MLKKTITYTDYNGVTRKEDFYFNLSQAEIAEMQLTTPGGMSEMLNRIVDAREDTELIKIFKDLIFRSYGEKSPDGKYFNKSEELSRAFSQTEAYSVLFMDLATDANKASDFVKGILPEDLQNRLNEQNNTLAVAG